MYSIESGRGSHLPHHSSTFTDETPTYDPCTLVLWCSPETCVSKKFSVWGRWAVPGYPVLISVSTYVQFVTGLFFCTCVSVCKCVWTIQDTNVLFYRCQIHSDSPFRSIGCPYFTPTGETGFRMVR